MAKQKFLNNFDTQFIAAVKDTPTTGTPATELDYGILRVSTGAAAALGTLTGGDYYILTSYKKSGTSVTNIEIVKVTDVDTSVINETRLTVLRAQEGTTAQSYVPGDYVSLYMTKGGAERMTQGVVGTEVQAWDADLDWIAANTTAAGKALLDDADAAAQRITLGLGTAATSASTDFADAAHVGGGGTAHANVVAAGAAGFMTGADKSKLDGIAAGATANTGTVTTVSVVTGNGLAGTVANPGTTPAITLTTSVNGMVKGNGTAFSAATVRTDYAEPTTALATGLLKNTTTTGAHTIAVEGTDYVAPTGADGVVTRQMFKDTGMVFYDSGATNALDYVNGSCQRWAPNTGAQTLSIANWPPTGNLGELLIQGVNLGAATITWPTINWIKSDGTMTTTFSSNGVTLQASGTDFVYLWTRDAGTTIYGKVVR